MFVIKKLLGALLQPYFCCLLLLLVALCLLWLTSRQRLGKALATVATLLLLVGGYEGCSDLLVEPLEARFQPLRGPLHGIDPGTRFVVVLGSSHTPDARLPPPSQLDGPALGRLVEGVRLQRLLPGSHLLLSGGNLFGTGVHAEVMRAAAESLGVPPAALIVENGARDTADEARLLTARVQGAPFLLVTSASHMPRAVALFARHGARAQPAPADFMDKDGEGAAVSDLLPSPSHLLRLDRAVHEYVGMLWARLRGAS